MYLVSARMGYRTSRSCSQSPSNCDSCDSCNRSPVDCNMCDCSCSVLRSQVPNSGRRRHESRIYITTQPLSTKMYSPLATLVLFASAVFRIAEACSSRSTPKPRPPSLSTRPNITFPTYECPKEYQSYYCLNGATCFTVKIEEDVIYNCECADGFTGSRCEFKDLDGTYLPTREKVMIETASFASGVTVAVIFFVIVSIAIYVYVRRKQCNPKDRQQQQQSSYPSISPQSKRAIQSKKIKPLLSDLEKGDDSTRIPDPISQCDYIVSHSHSSSGSNA